ncbi:M20/M25/M40 family metallo-hydrolase [Streptomyces chartreusis]|uniref:M20/M25/M40 family metallo-hydrolase n=1 Tax=Streptomyces chartreusis TaxID=1969 RepID=UPI00372104E9
MSGRQRDGGAIAAVHRLERRPGRRSVVAVARGAGGGRSLMLNGHLDTAGHAGHDGDPLAPRVSEARMYGRGALDMKGGIATVMVAAARATAGGRLRGDVLLACVADEEYGSSGTEEVLESFPLLGTGTVHASVIRGGEETSTHPAHCRVTLERRTVPGEKADGVEREVAGLLDRLAATFPDFRYRLIRGVHREPFEADPDAPIVRTLTRHAERALGHPPVVRAERCWTDCALLDRAGIPCLLFGADGEGAHAATEYVDLASLDRLTDVLTATITDFCS